MSHNPFQFTDEERVAYLHQLIEPLLNPPSWTGIAKITIHDVIFGEDLIEALVTGEPRDEAMALFTYIIGRLKTLVVDKKHSMHNSAKEDRGPNTITLYVSIRPWKK